MRRWIQIRIRKNPDADKKKSPVFKFQVKMAFISYTLTNEHYEHNII